MSKNIHLRVASKLFFADRFRDIPSMVDELSDIVDDSIDFTFVYPCELNEKKIWKEKFIKELCRSLKNGKVQ